MNNEHNEYEYFGYSCLVYYKDYPPYAGTIERKLITSTGNFLYEVKPTGKDTTLRIPEEYAHCIVKSK